MRRMDKQERAIKDLVASSATALEDESQALKRVDDFITTAFAWHEIHIKELKKRLDHFEVSSKKLKYIKSAIASGDMTPAQALEQLFPCPFDNFPL